MNVGAERNDAAPDVTTFSHDGSAKDQSNGSLPTAIPSDDISQRINHLENLVNRLVAERPPAWTPPDSIGNSTVGTYTPEKSDRTEGESTVASDVTIEDTFPVKTVGRTVIDGTQSVYLDGDDWSVVLQEASDP